MGSFNAVFPRPQNFIALSIDDQNSFDLMFNSQRQRNKVGENTKEDLRAVTVAKNNVCVSKST